MALASIISDRSNCAQAILIGIAGPSGCGKTTYAKHLVDRLHSPLRVIELDDFFMNGVSVYHPILGYVRSDEEPETLDVARLLILLKQIKLEPQRHTRYHRFTEGHQPVYVIVEGFILFALSDELTNMFDIRIVFESTQSQCRINRYRRALRISDSIPDDDITIPPNFQQWFDCLVWAGHLKRRSLQISKADQVFNSEEYNNKQYTAIDNYIDKRLKSLRD